MKRIVVPVNDEDPAPIVEFIEEALAGVDYSSKAIMQIQVAIEEIFVNITRYSGLAPEGAIEVSCEVLDEPLRAVVCFVDDGVPFDPLAPGDPDISPEGLMGREGGLGIFMVKQMMDDVSYAHEHGKNMLTITKCLA